MGSGTAVQTDTLLQAGDPEPVTIVNGLSESDILLVCEHAGKSIPAALGNLGLAPEIMDRHIACDIGAEVVARHMAVLLDAPLVLQPYSRLVVDCNRPADSPGAIPVVSDGVAIPGNQTMDLQQRRQRIDEIFVPFQNAVSEFLDSRRCKAAFAIHSFTPVLGPAIRRWDLAFLYRWDTETSQALAEAVGKRQPKTSIGMNEPYAVDDETDWFVPHHCERRGLPHSLIEIRNDHLGSDAACRDWAILLSEAIERVLGGGGK